MDKQIIELISCDAGDWSVLRMKSNDNDRYNYYHAGHDISSYAWIQLLKILGHNIREIKISDEDMEEGNY